MLWLLTIINPWKNNQYLSSSTETGNFLSNLIMDPAHGKMLNGKWYDLLMYLAILNIRMIKLHCIAMLYENIKRQLAIPWP